MFNYIVLALIGTFLLLSVITVFAELIGKRWTAAGLIIRSIRIRLREISLLSVCTSSIVLLIFGLVVGDDCFAGIWLAVAMMFASLFVLNPEDALDLRKRRKKAKKSRLAALLPENEKLLMELPELSELPELEPIVINSDTAEQKG